MFRRIALFIATNIAIIVVLTIIFGLFGIQPYLSSQGINYGSLMIFALIIGFTGSFISLFISKFMAKSAYRIQMIESPSSPLEASLINTVQRLAKQSNIGMPEVGTYESPEPNAFATGWNRNNSLVAVSTGLIDRMRPEEVEAVLAHEVSHIANGDMITMSLLQGVVNTFVIFFARIAAFVVMNLFRDDNNGAIGGLAYYGIAILFEIIFGILASVIVMWFSRYREFRADAGSAKLVGKDKMIAALKRLQQAMDVEKDDRAPSMATMKISSRSRMLALFASHPPLEKRIEALQQLR